MKTRFGWALSLGLLLLFPGCGGGDDMAVCNDAWDEWCACENVSCEGRPTSCTGPDKEWAECVLAAEDACTAACE